MEGVVIMCATLPVRVDIRKVARKRPEPRAEGRKEGRFKIEERLKNMWIRLPWTRAEVRNL